MKDFYLITIYFLSSCVLAFLGARQDSLIYGIVPYAFLVLSYLFIAYKHSKETSLLKIKKFFYLAFFSKLIFIITPVILTTDIYRYLWEAKLINFGISPFQFAPNSTDLLMLRDATWLKVDHAHLSAIYPPVAQYALGFFGTSVISWKVFLLVCEIGTVFFLLKLLDFHNISRGRCLWYVLLPLATIEIIWSAHLEGFMILMMIASCYYIEVSKIEKTSIKNAIFAAIFFSAAFLVKYVAALPVVFLLFYYRKQYSRQFYGVFVLTSLIFVSLVSFPFIDSELTIFNSLGVYLEHWRFNDCFLHLMGWMKNVDWEKTETFVILKRTLIGIWFFLTLFILRIQKSAYIAIVSSFLIYLLCSSVFHPWYALWFAPFLCFTRSFFPVVLCILLPLSYAAFALNIETLPSNIKLFEFIPVFVIVVFEFLKPKTLARD